MQFVASLPADYKIKGRIQKYILKKAAAGIVPDPLIWRRKAGFGGPVRAWVMRDLRDMIDTLLSRERIAARGLLDPDEVAAVINAQRSGKEDNALRIWALLTLELWLQTFVDRDGAAPLAVPRT